MRHRTQSVSNRRTGLVLLSIAAAFFFATLLNYVLLK